jgi:hypothetical protein
VRDKAMSAAPLIRMSTVIARQLTWQRAEFGSPKKLNSRRSDEVDLIKLLFETPEPLR